jgi:hypothetical protein
MKVSTEIDNNFGFEKITQLVDNNPLMLFIVNFVMWLLKFQTVGFFSTMTRSTREIEV